MRLENAPGLGFAHENAATVCVGACVSGGGGHSRCMTSQDEGANAGSGAILTVQRIAWGVEPANLEADWAFGHSVVWGILVINHPKG